MQKLNLNINCELYFDNTFIEQLAKSLLAFYDEYGKRVQVKFKDSA